ncbi:MAG TPA: hydrogenase 3 maturation endopeptidase HyCI [candidate division Zixibacteria bacterium]|nr:hydrogenase 3 maturation endopeptidase HyCI [candidate division Zixibacteria bacterium]
MKQKIKNSKALEVINRGKKISIMGIGNFDRADDFAGIAVIEKIEKNSFSENIQILNAGPVPEAFTGKIKEFIPNLLVIIDAAEMNEKPGTIRVFTEKDIDEAYMVTPHKVSMNMYMKYLRYFIEKIDAIFIGIQPASLSYSEPITEKVQESIDYLSEVLIELLQKVNGN